MRKRDMNIKINTIYNMSFISSYVPCFCLDILVPTIYVSKREYGGFNTSSRSSCLFGRC